MNEVVIKVENLHKKYKLGTIGGHTLQAELQSRWAKFRKKEDPNTKIGMTTYDKNEEFWALQGVDFKVYKGETIGIIGSNGAGKSTLLKILSRITTPTEGKVYIRGRISSMLEVGTGFHRELTGRENVYLNGAILGMKKEEIDRKFNEIVEFAEMEQFIDTPVKRYSSGMYVKLAFSVAAHLDSDILIMDEVLAVGDMSFQQKCLKKMKDIAKNEGKTILYVSHNMNTINDMCNRCIVLDKGSIKYEGNTEKAIQTYFSKNFKETTGKINLVDKKRPRGFTPLAKLTSVEIKGENGCIINQGGSIKCSLSWEVLENIKDMFIRITIRYNGMPVCTSISDTFYS